MGRGRASRRSARNSSEERTAPDERGSRRRRARRCARSGAGWPGARPGRAVGSKSLPLFTSILEVPVRLTLLVRAAWVVSLVFWSGARAAEDHPPSADQRLDAIEKKIDAVAGTARWIKK